jgi:hypothetical protein
LLDPVGDARPLLPDCPAAACDGPLLLSEGDGAGEGEGAAGDIDMGADGGAAAGGAGDFVSQATRTKRTAATTSARCMAAMLQRRRKTPVERAAI